MELLARHFRPGHVTLVLLLLVPLAGCSILRGGGGGGLRELDVTLVGRPDLNGGGNAAVVRLYALAGNANLQLVPPDLFWADDQAALGNELLGAPREVVLFPGATEALTFPLEPGVQFVGIAADLRDPDPDRWRTLLPVETLRRKRVRVTVGERALTADVLDR